VVLLGRKYSRLRLDSGKYTFPSIVTVFSLSAMTLPFQIARAIVAFARLRFCSWPARTTPAQVTDMTLAEIRLHCEFISRQKRKMAQSGASPGKPDPGRSRSPLPLRFGPIQGYSKEQF
jgi:hypothetical protein